jgi:hypothetical protein
MLPNLLVLILIVGLSKLRNVYVNSSLCMYEPKQLKSARAISPWSMSMYPTNQTKTGWSHPTNQTIMLDKFIP